MIEGLVSIIMPSYNAARFIGESINSVLLQTYSHWELLIADDCSKDNSVEVARGYRDWETDRKSTRLNSSHITRSRMPSSA